MQNSTAKAARQTLAVGRAEVVDVARAHLFPWWDAIGRSTKSEQLVHADLNGPPARPEHTLDFAPIRQKRQPRIS